MTDWDYPPEVVEFYEYCRIVNLTESDPWKDVRSWLRDTSKTTVAQALMVQGDSESETPLHLICKNGAPYDIVDIILKAVPLCVQMIDTKGRTPLHYAAGFGADDRVLHYLAEAYPIATQTGDKEGDVPLHFALRSKGTEISTTCAKVLSAGHANNIKDANMGMLPMHYACAYGAPVDVLEILAEAYGEPLEQATDKRGMIPLHYVCANPYRPMSPDAAAFLLEVAPLSININDNNSSLPLHLLATKVASNESKPIVEAEEAYIDNPLRILELYLKAKPMPTADFLTALQTLPESLRDRAVTTPSMQEMLNQKMAMRLPTAFAVLDFTCYIAMIFSLFYSVTCTIEERYPGSESQSTCTHFSLNITVLFISTSWILLHEILQILSLLALGLKTYITDFTNYLDVIGVFMGFLFLGDMLNEFGFIGGPRCKGGDDRCEIEKLDRFRWVASIVLLLFWYSFLSFLKSTFIDFAVFVGGLKNVVRGFFPFLMALAIILIAFANIFRLIYFDSEYCLCEKNQNDESCMVNYADEDFSGFDRFCDGLSVLKVYVMLLGEVSDEEFFVRDLDKEGFLQVLGIAFFISFMFLVVILLANVLIAIVTDSYGVIKNEKAAIVFWTNRLDYIAECDAIINGPWKKRVLELFCVSESKTIKDGSDSETFGAIYWKRLIDPPGGDLSDLKVFSFEFWVYIFLRLLGWMAALCWIIVGYVTFGLLWPPQVREGIFFSNINRSSGGEAKELEQRSIEVRSLREEVKDLHNDILHELTSDRKQVIAMKAQLNDMKDTLQNEMKTVKQVVTMLFDLQSLD